MPRIRLVALDVDGTLLDDAKRITPRTREAVRAASAAGVAVVLASARPPRSLRVYYNDLGLTTPQVNYNGALVWDEPAGRVLLHTPLPATVATRVIAYVRERLPDAAVSCEILDRWHTDRVDPRYLTETARLFPPDVIAPLEAFAHLDVTKLMFQAEPEAIDLLTPSVQVEFDRAVNVVRVDPDLLQLMSPAADKVTGVAWVADRLGVSWGETMAVGDHLNDLNMISMAEVGVAMGNAHGHVKHWAQWVAPDNEHDGVAAAIERFVLS